MTLPRSVVAVEISQQQKLLGARCDPVSGLHCKVDEDSINKAYDLLKDKAVSLAPPLTSISKCGDKDRWHEPSVRRAFERRKQRARA